VAAEVYSIPSTAVQEGRILRRAVLEEGALSAVLNCEAPHEEDAGDGVRRLLDAFAGAAPVHAATDFRGGRLSRPYHLALAEAVASWHPMVYPTAFYPSVVFFRFEGKGKFGIDIFSNTMQRSFVRH
jgi:hypothetical protein